MPLFEKFNFDIIIAIVLIGFIIYARYFRFKRQTFFTLSFLLPFVILYFSYNFIETLTEKIGLFGFIEKSLPFSSEKKFPAALTVAILAYFIINIIIRLFSRLFREPIEKQIINKNNIYSKIANIIMGILNGYVAAILIMFALQPVITIDYNRPLTAAIIKTSNPVISVSFLNKMSIKAEEYKIYKEALRNISGQQVELDYNELLIHLEEVAILNDDFSISIYNQLNDETQNLITAHLKNDNYIACLLDNNEGVILDRIIALEQANPILPQLIALRNQANNNIGYWHLYGYLRDKSIDFNDFVAVATAITNNVDKLAVNFNALKDKIIFKNTADNFHYFLNHYQELLGDKPLNLSDYINSFSALLSNYDALLAFGQDFLSKHQYSDHPITQKIILTFEKILNNKDKIIANPEIPLDVNIAFASDYKIWFENDIWEKHLLYKSYLVDMIIDPKLNGYDLYHRYFFYRHFDLKETLTLEDLLSELEAVVNKGILTEKQATEYFTSLFTISDSLMRDLNNQNRLHENFYQDLSTNNHRFISNKLKEQIQ
ncbi:MAG: hypothetical protein M0R05_02565 [Bacilli bacterium]|nr:hypothetical protein [Bacilli bacterium]MDD4077136.1 hypothetical protein [Bacilli bacterium]MDD4388042.1 hypothetical protein [Bacilli bacterium]